MRIQRFWRRGHTKNPSDLEDRLQRILADSESEGLLDPYSGQMIRGVLKLRDTVVREIMIPRTEMVALPSNASIGEIQQLLRLHGFTRIPVYADTIDNIIGILNVKDLLKEWPETADEWNIASNLRKPYYIPESKNVSSLLHEFKRDRHHLAIVMDEYGGTSGLVTLEDLIEEIVGDLFDDTGEDEKRISKLPDGSILMDGRIGIEDAGECLETPIPEGPYETLGGFILHRMRKIPAAGETIRFGNLEMTIEAADERRIRKIRVRKKKDGIGETETGSTIKENE